MLHLIESVVARYYKILGPFDIKSKLVAWSQDRPLLDHGSRS